MNAALPRRFPDFEKQKHTQDFILGYHPLLPTGDDDLPDCQSLRMVKLCDVAERTKSNCRHSQEPEGCCSLPDRSHEFPGSILRLRPWITGASVAPIVGLGFLRSHPCPAETTTRMRHSRCARNSPVLARQNQHPLYISMTIRETVYLGVRMQHVAHTTEVARLAQPLQSHLRKIQIP